MKSYPNLISEQCPTKATTELVAKTIPILIRWAKSGITTNTYGDLSSELGKGRAFSYIGAVLGYTEDVMNALRKETNQSDIPTLNALVKKTGRTDIPSNGFKYVHPGFDDLPPHTKKEVAAALNAKAIDYPNWDQVLQALCLKPSVVNSEKDEALIRGGTHFGKGGEGPQHLALKEYVYSHPESVGLRHIALKETEHILLSGDKLDVYFEQKDGTRIAVEVKSIVSPDSDILRGLYQCVKYKSVLDAEGKTHGLFGKNDSLLVLEGCLSETNQQVKDSLGIRVIEMFKKL